MIVACLGSSPDAAQRRARTDLDLAEANHRIANSFAAIAAVVRLYARDREGPQRAWSGTEVRDLLGDIASRVETAAQLHRMLALPQGEEAFDVAAYLVSVARQVMTAGSGAWSLSAEMGRTPRIPSRDALALAMIVTEATTNALKYAHPDGSPGVLHLSCFARGDTVCLRIADDGVGPPAEVSPQTAQSLGFRIIRGLAARLGAKTIFTRSQGGFALSLYLPAV